jgi:hypothetical protein
MLWWFSFMAITLAMLVPALADPGPSAFDPPPPSTYAGGRHPVTAC